MLTNSASAIEVACDESGNDGENLFSGVSTVFAHGSVSISIEQATELTAEVHLRTRSQSTELKSKELLRPKNLSAAHWLLRHPALAAHSLVNLTEKRYFLTCKLFDSTVEEQMHASGVDICENDMARRAAMFLYSQAPKELGEDWDRTLETYNQLLRSPDESRIESHLATLRGQLIALGQQCSDPLNDFIAMIWGGTDHLRSLARHQAGVDRSEKLRTLDPVLCAIGQTARAWGERSGKDVVVIHDQAKVLTPEMIESLKHHLPHPEIVAPSLADGSVVVKDVQLVDSKSDPRVQVADLLAGIGRTVTEAALRGIAHPLAADLQQMIDPLSMWGDIQSWLLLHAETTPA